MNEKRTLTQADINAIVDALKNGDFAKQLVTDFARIVGVRIQEEDIIDSDAACRLLGNISHATLKNMRKSAPKYAQQENTRADTVANACLNSAPSANRAHSEKTKSTPSAERSLVIKKRRTTVRLLFFSVVQHAKTTPYL